MTYKVEVAGAALIQLNGFTVSRICCPSRAVECLAPGGEGECASDRGA